MADNGWIYRYDFENGDCYVGKEGSSSPYLRAAEHLQDALTVVYPSEFSGFKIRLRSTSAKYVSVNRYTRTNVQKFGWQWGFEGRINRKTGQAYTHEEIEEKRKKAGGGVVKGIFWTIDDVTKNGWSDIWGTDRDEFEARSKQEFQDVFDKMYSWREDNKLTGKYQLMAKKVKSWKFITVDVLRKKFQVTSDNIQSLKDINQAKRQQGGDDLIPVLNVIFGKDGQKKQDWINIFYNEIATKGKGGSSMLDVCEMFATLSAYYEHRIGNVTNSESNTGEMLNNEILKAKFDFLIDNNRVPAAKAVRQSIDLQKELANDENLLNDIILRLRKTGNKGGQNIKTLYQATSSEISKIIAEQIKTVDIWGSVKDSKEEMFKNVFNLLTSETFSKIGNKKQDGYLPLN